MSRNLARSTVHLKVYPTTRTFAERREVLRAVQKFGEVTSFRSLKFDLKYPVPNAFICTFKEASSMDHLLSSGTIRFHIANPAPAPSSPPTNPSSTPDIAMPETTEFTIQANISSFPHEKHIRASPLYESWVPVSTSSSNIAAALSKRLPKGPSAIAMRDWESEAAMSKNAGGSVPSVGDGATRMAGTGGRAGAWATMPWRLRRKMLQSEGVGEGEQGEQKAAGNSLPEVMKGISQYASRQKMEARQGDEAWSEP